MECLACGMLRILNVGDVGCWGCGVWDVGCSRFEMLEMWDIRDVGCWDVEYLNCEMFKV